ncbi:MAG: tetratricopeptide repeat protein [Planctomycetes bacterium]|nr:tetratricopeptide repeat protein [Planctomycetota bacterium]
MNRKKKLIKIIQQSRDYPKAIESYKEAIRLKPDYIEAHNNLGIAYLLSGNRDKALAEYNILKSLNKELADKLYNLMNK